MTNFAANISSAAMLALAALPIAALATASHAETRVQVSDINLLTPEGVATFNARAAAATQRYCISERTLSGHSACVAGVKAELNEKMAAVRVAQAERASKTFAAR